MMTTHRFRGLTTLGLLVGLSACQGTEEHEKRTGAEPDASLGVTISELQVVGADEGHVPTFANGNFGQLQLGGKERTEEAEVSALRPSLLAVSKVFHADPTELAFQRAVTDGLGDRHFVYAQRKHGREVLGAALVLHTRNDAVYAVHGNARADLDAPRDARLSPEDAIAVARKESARLDRMEVEAHPRMAYWPAGETLELVYRVNVTGRSQDGMAVDDDVIINAVSGAVVQRLPNIYTLKNRAVYDVNHGGSANLPGTLVRAEGGAAVADPTVNTNYDLLGTTYDCYKNLFNRDSYDGAGSKLVSSVHYGYGYANAGWSGSKNQMLYGDGDGVTFGNMVNALDVTAHEVTHGLTISTSNLLYFAEPGALNESMSDIMGSVCEWYRNGQVVNANTWKCAEEIYTPSTSGDALRYMNDPRMDGQSLDYFDQTFSPFTDVHYSSGIPNLAFYLLSQGGQHPRGRSSIAVRGIGIAKAAQVFHRANTVLLLGKTMATFADAKLATEQAAAQLGYSAADIASVTAAWQAVGVGKNILVAGQGLSIGQSMVSTDRRFSLVLQNDGNLVLWDATSVLWTANIGGQGALSAHMQDDGNFVVYRTSTPTVGQSVWSSMSWGHPGAYLILQNDGNLVVYDKDGVTPLWNSETWGH
ncbi:M4 family metallopeptidase [Corallococcus exiguus]|uniref:M4 family metallopeptidase n=1 Tax=Corallococcus exiguus TaxID=83462 RepID=UPI001A8F21AC|nr:M4 family metallopeptidase [Corallococcus exiguus]MBN8465422.1 M4 family metallopeptidase [Corallococcus exiguus]